MTGECICKNCPSFVGNETKLDFCVTEKSNKIKNKSGCICGACPMYKKLSLKKGYYCFIGPEIKI